jgi:hypothetical protein
VKRRMAAAILLLEETVGGGATIFSLQRTSGRLPCN